MSSLIVTRTEVENNKNWKTTPRLAGIQQHEKKFESNKAITQLPVILEKWGNIVHHRCQETRHPFLLIASKHHVQNWSENLS